MLPQTAVCVSGPSSQFDTRWPQDLLSANHATHRPPPPNFAAIFQPTEQKLLTRQSDFKFFTLNFTLSREFHPFENRAFLERSRALPAASQ
jgi:hypothetical protein